MSDTFAIYRNQIVLVLGFDEIEALVSFDNGHEEYVSLQSLEII